ncbi:unnamed protein product [Allacma fusca]|uniref:Uncharacterized protein n=1 Tax=Allacma fusca TaxID=39272 RepID=A0A8J2K3S6_9HEXA|nr:unnamed protein product [Allacma fusca]
MMDVDVTSTEHSLGKDITNELDGVASYVYNTYNKTVSYIQSEVDDLGMSDHQKIGVILIFIMSVMLLTVSMIFLCCGKKSWCRTWCKEEEKYTVYRKMVEFDHIIALEPPKSDKGKLPI